MPQEVSPLTPWTLRIVRMRKQLSVTVLLATVARGADLPAGTSTVELHPLVATTEALYQEKLCQGDHRRACDELIGLASQATDLKNQDKSHLKLLTALLYIADSEQLEASAQGAANEATALYPKAKTPSFKTSNNSDSKHLKSMLSTLGTMLSKAKQPRSSPGSSSEITKPESGPVDAVVSLPKALLGTVDALLAIQQTERAKAILEWAQSQKSMPMSAPEQAQVELRWGILLTPVDEASGEQAAEQAQAKFQKAVDADPGISSLPADAPPRAQAIFKKVRRPAVTTTTAPKDLHSPQQTGPPSTGAAQLNPQWRWDHPTIGRVVGGVGLLSIVGGAAAGVFAFSSYNSEKKALIDGNQPALERYRADANAQANLADALFGIGAVGVIGGVALDLIIPGGTPVQVVPNGKGGGVSLAVGGHF